MKRTSLDLDDATVAEFQRSILQWYGVYGRDLPWRGDPGPYHEPVSEVMLQQAQAGWTSSILTVGIAQV